MKKGITIVVVLLVLAIAVTAYLNRGDLAAKRFSQVNATVTIKWDNNKSTTVDLDYILTLEADEFTVTQKSSEKPAEDQVYTGVALKLLLQEQGIVLKDKSKVVVVAVDGYTVARSIDEVLDDENIYLVYKRGGEWLGTKEEGGSGPYQLVARKDEFAQYWCKFVTEIEVK